MTAQGSATGRRGAGAPRLDDAQLLERAASLLERLLAAADPLLDVKDSAVDSVASASVQQVLALVAMHEEVRPFLADLKARIARRTARRLKQRGSHA